jgi:predicted RNA-binding Zn-ribbon protein involved in translation (DUF1610 family)
MEQLNKIGLGIIKPACCPHMCDLDPSHSFDIRLIEMKLNDNAWIATGKGKILRNSSFRTHCPHCAQYYTAIAEYIPIATKPFACPECGKTQIFSFQITQVREENNAFEFEVIFRCQDCGKRRSFKKLLKDILKIIKLEIGPTGVTVKNA